MKNSDRKLIGLLWIVIAVLLVGVVAITLMLLNHANQADKNANDLKGSNESYKRQVEQLRAERTAKPTPTYTAIPSPPSAATPTPSPAAKTKP